MMGGARRCQAWRRTAQLEQPAKGRRCWDEVLKPGFFIRIQSHIEPTFPFLVLPQRARALLEVLFCPGILVDSSSRPLTA